MRKRGYVTVIVVGLMGLVGLSVGYLLYIEQVTWCSVQEQYTGLQENVQIKNGIERVKAKLYEDAMYSGKWTYYDGVVTKVTDNSVEKEVVEIEYANVSTINFRVERGMSTELRLQGEGTGKVQLLDDAGVSCMEKTVILPASVPLVDIAPHTGNYAVKLEGVNEPSMVLRVEYVKCRVLDIVVCVSKNMQWVGQLQVERKEGFDGELQIKILGKRKEG